MPWLKPILFMTITASWLHISFTVCSVITKLDPVSVSILHLAWHLDFSVVILQEEGVSLPDSGILLIYSSYSLSMEASAMSGGDPGRLTSLTFQPHLCGLHIEFQSLLGTLPGRVPGTPVLTSHTGPACTLQGPFLLTMSSCMALAPSAPATGKGFRSTLVQAVVPCSPAMAQQEWTSSGPEQSSEHHLLSFNHNFSSKV